MNKDGKKNDKDVQMNTYLGNADGKKVPLSTLQAKSRISVLHCSVLALFKALLVSVDTLHL